MKQVKFRLRFYNDKLTTVGMPRRSLFYSVYTKFFTGPINKITISTLTKLSC